MIRLLPILVLALALAACERTENDESSADDQTSDTETDTDTGDTGDTGDNDTASTDTDADDIQSTDILARTETADEAQVKHVLLGWKELAPIYRGRMDPRAKKRTKEKATELAQEIAQKLEADPDQIDELIQKHSEDPGSLRGDPYTVTPNAQFVPPFKKLGLRLKMNEVGIVKTDFGYHVMVRVPPPPPDALESADILEREKVTDSAKVKHILLGWKETNSGDPRAAERSREELEKLVTKTVAKLRKGSQIDPLMAELSEDPGSAKTGKSYPVSPNARLVPPFKALSLRLKKDEVGVVKSQFGIHIIKRVE